MLSEHATRATRGGAAIDAPHSPDRAPHARSDAALASSTSAASLASTAVASAGDDRQPNHRHARLPAARAAEWAASRDGLASRSASDVSCVVHLATQQVEIGRRLLSVAEAMQHATQAAAAAAHGTPAEQPLAPRSAAAGANAAPTASGLPMATVRVHRMHVCVCVRRTCMWALCASSARASAARCSMAHSLTEQPPVLLSLHKHAACRYTMPAYQLDFA